MIPGVRKSDQQFWSKEDMEQALKEIREKKIGWLLVFKTYNVPCRTFRIIAKSGHKKNNLGRHKPTFDKLDYAIAEAIGLKHRFNKEERFAEGGLAKRFQEEKTHHNSKDS
ncbi:hypothetical protein ILUMI_15036 [Ignelater luminosus]|uniref:Uncharacterized protein n=1 Tax=Ignelater luminosus TaxID=2038154 RepID=A0A8K0CTQ9_IGNLU|nr:hypothetical protein ILUMI_15036 [Ignelater luminosus]